MMKSGCPKSVMGSARRGLKGCGVEFFFFFLNVPATTEIYPLSLPDALPIYFLFGTGAAIAIILEMVKVPALTFALGMYLPLELNTPALVGGIISYYVGKKCESAGGETGRTMRERAVVIASGLMAGGALGGVFGAALRIPKWYREDLIRTPFYGNEAVSQGVSMLFFVGLCLYLWIDSTRRVGEK